MFYIKIKNRQIKSLKIVNINNRKKYVFKTNI